MARLFFSLVAAVVVAIVAARFAYNASVDPGDEPASEAWAQNKMEFVAWNNDKWTAWIHDGAFEQAPHDDGNWSRHSNASIAFTNWNGEAWQAKIDGEEFLLAHRGDWQGSVDRSIAIRYRDWSGSNQLRTVAELKR
jgi:hypothetical protein